MYEKEKKILPEFPRTLHMPIEPNATNDDKIATVEEMEQFLSYHVFVEEKVDGSNCGMALVNGQPLIRNRSHILNKAYSNTKTPAKQQFSPVWTWFYSNIEKFEKINKFFEREVSVYGEWMYARHTITYNKLPDLFITYDIFDPEAQDFIHPLIAMVAFSKAGFHMPQSIASGNGIKKDRLTYYRDRVSRFGDENQEGIYLKATDGAKIVGRLKMVNPNFESDDDWNKKPLVKNKVVKG